jgi:type VI secretion system protein ImpB
MDGKTGAEDLVSKVLHDPSVLQWLAAAPKGGAGEGGAGEGGGA